MKPAIVVLAVLTAGCSAKDGSNGPAGTSSLIATDVEAPGANCARGGTRVRVGVDANRDGVLDETEVSEIRYVCNGDGGGDGQAALVSIEDGAAGCAAGGFTIHWGLDTDGDGILAESERTGSAPICNGVDGLISLVDQVQLKAGSESCANGGVLIRSGVDANRNGALDDEEVDQEMPVCLPCEHPGSSNCTSGKLVSVAHVDVPYRPGVMAIGDVDGDGNQDVVISRFDNPALELWRGRGDGSFEAPTPAGSGVGSGRSIRLADFNGDGHLDLVGCTPSRAVAVLLGHGEGTFGDAVPLPGVNGSCLEVETLDFNGDGVIDLMLGTTRGVALLQGAGDGTFAPGPSFPSVEPQQPRGFTAGDLNGDGHLDLVWTETNVALPIPIAEVLVALNSGDGTFSDPVLSFRPQSCCLVELGDFNGDGQLDVLVAAGANGEGFDLRLGDGQGGFGAQWLGVLPFPLGAMALGDFDGDGRLDVVTTQYVTTTIYRGNGDGTLTGPSFQINAGGMFLSLGDINDDGKHDVVVHHINGQKVEVLIGD